MTALSNLPDPEAALRPRARILATAALLVVEFGALGAIFKHAIDFECRANWPRSLCESADAALISGYGMLGALALFVMLAPGALRGLVAAPGGRGPGLALNAAGLVLALVPVLLLREGSGSAFLVPTFLLWALAVPMLVAGALWTLAPWRRWRAFLAGQGAALAVCLAAGAAIPALALRFQPLWTIDWLTDATFSAVTGLLRIAGYDVQAYPVDKVIGAGEFFVFVDKACSGVEGLALVTLFVTLYLGLFRKELRFPRALLLYPLGLMASAGFNVLRIAGLLALGFEGHGDLAVGGFHSHAGWLTFTAVALGLIALAETMPHFKRTADRATVPRAAVPPLTRDPVAARILPFAVFMLGALVVSVASTEPGMLYPLRMAVVAAVLALFWPIYKALPWRVDPVAVAVGAVIGVVWVLIPVPPAESAAYGGLTGVALLGWYLARGLGTTVIVPLVEELFFRDYLESRLRRGPGLAWAVGAALVSAALFAALHDRWMEAFAAGLAFSWLARRGPVSDAIIAHAVANLLIFGAALALGNLALI